MQKSEHEGIAPITLPDGRPGLALDYEILFEPVEVPGEGMTSELASRHKALYDMVWNDPAAAIPELQRIVAEFPQVAMFKNWLQKAYSGAGRTADAEALGERLYRDHPDYLFARLGKASVYFQSKEYDKIKEVLPAFDLKLLYPERNSFHISEAVALWSFAGYLFHARGDDESAYRFLDLLTKLAPEHPATIELDDVLTLSGLDRAVRGLMARATKPRGRNRKQNRKSKRKRRS